MYVQGLVLEKMHKHLTHIIFYKDNWQVYFMTKFLYGIIELCIENLSSTFISLTACQFA